MRAFPWCCFALSAALFTSNAYADSLGPSARAASSPVDGRVVMRVNDEQVWDYPLTTPEANDTIVVKWRDDFGVLYACADARLYAFNANTGIVEERWYLPGKCTALTAESASIHATCEVGEADNRSTFEWRSDAPLARSAAMLPGVFAFLANKNLVTRTLEPLMGAAREQERDKRIAQDPTNPWWRFALADEDRSSPLRATDAHAIAAVDSRYAIDLMLAAHVLDALDPNLGDAAFRRGVNELKRAGYKPELATSLISMYRFIGRPSEPLDIDRDYEAIARHGRRVRTLAPRVEGAADFFAALAAAAKRRGESNAVAEWTRASNEAAPFRTFGGSSVQTRLAGHAIDAAIASMWAILLVFIAKLVRNLRAKPIAEISTWTRLNPFARWTLGERVGLTLASVSAISLMWYAAWGVAQIGLIASSPVELGSGSLGHPAAVRYTERFTGSRGGDLIHALALEQAGLSRTPGAARVTPSANDWADAWHRAAERSLGSRLHNPITAALSIAQMSETISTNESFHYDGAMVFSILAIVALLLLPLLPPYRASFEAADQTPRARILDWLVPGASPRYGAFGFFLAGAIATWLAGQWMLTQSDGAALTILDAIAMPNFAGYFGVRALPTLAADPSVPLYRAGGLLVIAHIAWMALNKWRNRTMNIAGN